MKSVATSSAKRIPARMAAVLRLQSLRVYLAVRFHIGSNCLSQEPCWGSGGVPALSAIQTAFTLPAFRHDRKSLTTSCRDTGLQAVNMAALCKKGKSGITART